MHPDVPVFSNFSYYPGKPNRTKKVIRFMNQEEERVIKNEVKRAEIEDEQQQHNGKIYFGSIKSKVPNLYQTDQQKVRRSKLPMNDQHVTKRRESGNLASAIGLYKSGFDIEKLKMVKQVSKI